VTRNRWWLVLVAVGAAGFLLRIGPVLVHGAFGASPDYDDGVNFSAAALLVQGVLPYRDFFYAHPPGGLLWLAPAALVGRAAGMDTGFALAGFMGAAAGAVNVVLLGRLGWRLWGPVAGLAAAGLYAVYPEALVAERTTFMEPVLNLACLGMASVLLVGQPGGGRPGPGLSRRRVVVAGVLAGLAVTVKLWAVAWVVGALVGVAALRKAAAAARFLAAAAAAALAVTLPLALASVGGFLRGVVLFQVRRPPDGVLPRGFRFYELLGFPGGQWDVVAGRHALTAVLALLGLVVAVAWARQPGRDAERLLAVAYVLTVAVFLASRAYWAHYNAHLALVECALAGLAAGTAWGWVVGRARAPARVVATVAGVSVLAVVVAAGILSLRRGVGDARTVTPELVALGHEVRALPAGECLFSFEPTWGLAGGRAPSVAGGGVPVVPDPYGQMVWSAVAGGRRFAAVETALADDAAQDEVVRLLGACRWAVLGWRGEWQLSPASLEWFRSAYEPLEPGPSGVTIWKRRG
jgi:hypothetical protein